MPNCPGETVFHNTPDWLLARDLHRGLDNSYLVVFRDKELYSIRDLRARHVGMLRALLAFLRPYTSIAECIQIAEYIL
jgi:hypothetical protein